MMKKKIQILGLEIDNYSVREAILLAESYLNGNSVSTIETVSMKMLTDAENYEVVGHAVREMDLTIIGEKEILLAAEITTPQRLKETTEHEFAHEFMKRVVRNRRKVYLLGEKAEHIDLLKDFLEEKYNKMLIVGDSALEECQGDYENIINQVNGEAADVLISILPTPLQEEFLMEYKNKMGVKVWYGMGDYTVLRTESVLKKFVRSFFHRHTLRKRIEQYQDEETK